jgi:hypothetical protein
MNKIIAILDLETAADSTAAHNLLKNILKNNKVENIAGEGKEKSLIISEGNFYLSPISSVTLLKRSLSNGDFESV